MMELRFTLDNYETELFRVECIPPSVGDVVWWGKYELKVTRLFWNLVDDEERYIVVEVCE